MKINTVIEHVYDTENGPRKVTLDVTTMAMDDLIFYANLGEKPAIQEIYRRESKNSSETLTDKI